MTAHIHDLKREAASRCWWCKGLLARKHLHGESGLYFELVTLSDGNQVRVHKCCKANAQSYVCNGRMSAVPEFNGLQPRKPSHE